MNRLLLCTLLLFSSGAHAWDGVKSGKITNIQVTHATNFAFRLGLNAGGICGTTGNLGWAYLNEGDSNYKVYVASLLAAKALNQTVTIYANKTFGGQFCNIQHISID